MITKQQFDELYAYDPITGIFTALFDSKNKRWKAGRVVGSVMQIGYVEIKTTKIREYCHRLAFLVMNGSFPPEGMEVDHINGDKTDNRWSNLRIVDRAGNASNMNSKGYAYFKAGKRKKRWKVQKIILGKMYMRYCLTEQEAKDYVMELRLSHGLLNGI